MTTIKADLLLNNSGQDLLFPKSVTDQILVSPENVQSLTILLSQLLKNVKKERLLINNHETLNNNSLVTVPKYIVGSGLLSIYLNGIKATINETYEEVGDKNSESSSIKIISQIPQHIDIEAEVISLQY